MLISVANVVPKMGKQRCKHSSVTLKRRFNLTHAIVIRVNVWNYNAGRRLPNPRICVTSPLHAFPYSHKLSLNWGQERSPIDCADDNERHFPFSAEGCIRLQSPSHTATGQNHLSPAKVILWLSLPKFLWTEWLDTGGGNDIAPGKCGGGQSMDLLSLAFSTVLWLSFRLQVLPLCVRYCC